MDNKDAHKASSAIEMAQNPATKAARSMFRSSRLLFKLPRSSLRSYRPPTLFRTCPKVSGANSDLSSRRGSLKASAKHNRPDQANLPLPLPMADSGVSSSDQASPSPASAPMPTTFLHALVDAISEEPSRKGHSAPVKLPSFSTLASFEPSVAKSNGLLPSSSLAPYSATPSQYANARYATPFPPQTAYAGYPASIYPYPYPYPYVYPYRHPSGTLTAAVPETTRRPLYSFHGMSMSSSSLYSSYSPSTGDASRRSRYSANDGHAYAFGHASMAVSTAYPSTRWYNPIMPSYTSAGMHCGTARHGLPPLAIKSDSQPPFTGRYGHDDLAKAYECYPRSTPSNSLASKRAPEAKMIASGGPAIAGGFNGAKSALYDHVVPMVTANSATTVRASTPTKKRQGAQNSDSDSDADLTDDSASDDVLDDDRDSLALPISQRLTTHVSTGHKLDISDSGATVSLPQIPFNQHYAQRKAHKLAERKRRREMKRLFDSLRILLPIAEESSVDAKVKLSKWEILNGAVETIDALVRKQNLLLSKRSYLLPRLDLVSSGGSGVSSRVIHSTTSAQPIYSPSDHGFSMAPLGSFPSNMVSSPVSLSPSHPAGSIQLGARK